jgi:replication-associated recombination protein RarA
MKKTSQIVEPLEELQQLIGMSKIKESIFNQIIFYLQDLEDNKDMLHMAIQGKPGVGKTCVINILAKIYKSLGLLSKGHITKVKRDDFIAGFLGQTSPKTRKLLEKAKGGILVIDEAYALGNEELRDSYSKEAIDMLTAFLTEECEDLICIIAGYKHQLDKCFFAYNEGLERRFSRYTIDEYSAEELRQIYLKIVKENNWNINDKEIPISFFENNKDYFPFNGGDMLVLFAKCKHAHSKRLLAIANETELIASKKNINYDDLKYAMDLFILDPDIAKRKETPKYLAMYN